MFSRQNIAMLVAEFLGTAILTMVVLAVSLSNIGIGYFVSFGAGLAMALMVLVAGGISGAILNPALTLGLWSVRKIGTVQAVLYILVQLLGGYVAYLLFNYISGTDLSGRSATFSSTTLVAEVVGASVLGLGYAAAVYQNALGGTRAALIGVAYTVGVMVAAAHASAGYLNPAIALGAHVWQWGSYVLGPVLGALIGFNLYNLLFAAGGTSPAVAVPAMVAPVRSNRTVTGKANGVTSKKTVKAAKVTKKPARKTKAAVRRK